MSGDLSGSGTTSINAQLASNVVGANELNVTGNGTTSQFLRSDGDGTFTWATPTDTNTTYSASTGLTLTGTAFSVNYGTAAGTACQGNDSRLSNSRQCNNSFDDAATARTNLGLGSLATLSSVNAATITDNSVGAAELNVTGNGTTSQFLRSDGDGTFTWATPTDTDTTYSAGTNLSLVGTTFSVSSNPSFTDIYLDDQILSTGDTNTYMQFHAADQWRVVVGGSERLEVKNSSPHVLVSGDLNSTSDERLKDNIKPITNALSDVTQLEGVTFDWKDTGTRGHGFIAQQVEPILPDLVNTDEETGMKSINYIGMIGHLVEAIKELKAEVEELKR